MLLITKTNSSTLFMQQADVFEKNKFVGHIVRMQGEATKTPKEILLALKSKDTDEYEVVGFVVPDVGAAFLEGHEVLSTGKQWVTVKELCESQNAPLEYVKK